MHGTMNVKCIFLLVMKITRFNKDLLLYDGYRVFMGVKRQQGRGPTHLLSSKAEAPDVMHLHLRCPSVPAQACYGVNFVFTFTNNRSTNL